MMPGKTLAPGPAGHRAGTWEDLVLIGPSVAHPR